MKFVNPKNDVAFRKIFGSEDKTEILVSFLNVVLNLEGDKAIQSIQILNPYQTPKLEKLKTTILDVRAKDKRGITFIVEMQIANTASLRKRFIYYVTKAYASQIDRGEDYPKLNQVIFIGILDFEMFENSPRYLSRHQILDTETQQQELKDLEFNFIELPKFTKTEREIETLLEKWLYFIKHADDLEVIPEHVDNPALEQAYKLADQFGWSQEDLEAYEYRGMRMQDERGAITYAHEKGRQEGFQEGRQEGRQEGFQEGRQEATLDSARKMVADGLPPEMIAKYTGLSSAEIKSLTNEA